MTGVSAREFWVSSFERDQYLIEQQTQGLSDADALLQMPTGGNCMNWVLGHIAEHRNKMLVLLGHTGLMSAEWAKRYETDSPPVTDGSDAMPLVDMLALLGELKGALREAILAAEQDWLDEIIVPARNHSRWNRLEFLLWHEAYHIGQLEYLRNLAGHHEQII